MRGNFFQRYAAMHTVISSVVVTVSQIPFSANNSERTKDMGKTMTKPRSREMKCAGRGRSAAVKRPHRMMLIAVSGSEVKYKRIPFSLMSCKIGSALLLNSAVMGDVQINMTA